MKPDILKPDIPFARPDIGEGEKAAVLRVLDSGWLTTGSEAPAFEREFRELVGCRHALAVNSATAGLHLALEAAGVGPGDVVLTTPYTFTATAEVIRYVGAEVAFVDIDPVDGLIDPSLLEPAIRRLKEIRDPGRPAAVIPVHLGGAVCAMDVIAETCSKHGLFLLEDAAHALPSNTANGHAGTFGDAGVFSFYATKPVTTGEGGMICTDSDDLAKRISIMRLHGIDREAWERYRSPDASWYYEVVEAGFKYNMPDILAAIGRVQLSRAQQMLDRRRQIARRYRQELSSCDFLTLPQERDGHAWHLFPVRFETDSLGCTRDRIIRALRNEGIGTSVHYIPLHLMPYYAKRYRLSPEDFPVSLDRYRNTVSLPIYPSLREIEVERVIEAVRALPDLLH